MSQTEIINMVINSGVLVALFGVAVAALNLITTYLKAKTQYIIDTQHKNNELDILDKAEAAIKTAVAKVAQDKADQIRKEYNGSIPEELKVDLKYQAHQLAISLMGPTIYDQLTNYKKEVGVDCWIDALIEVYVRQLK